MNKKKTVKLTPQYLPGFVFCILFVLGYVKSDAQDIPNRYDDLEKAKASPSDVRWLELKDKGYKEFPKDIF
ncbi:MAG: hypothetical protein MJA30_15975, partial [Cytophagales bacterium]|nr:hypothetical protein [Cytophagales bacterium]